MSKPLPQIKDWNRTWCTPVTRAFDARTNFLGKFLGMDGDGGWSEQQCRIATSFLPTNYLEFSQAMRYKDELDKEFTVHTEAWNKATEAELIDRQILGYTYKELMPEDEGRYAYTNDEKSNTDRD